MADDQILVAVLCPNREAWQHWVWREKQPGDTYRKHQDRLYTEDVVFHAVYIDTPHRIRGYRFDSYVYSDEDCLPEADCENRWLNRYNGAYILGCLRASLK